MVHLGNEESLGGTGEDGSYDDGFRPTDELDALEGGS